MNITTQASIIENTNTDSQSYHVRFLNNDRNTSCQVRRTTTTNKYSSSVLFYVAWPKHVLIRDVCNKKEVWKKLLRNANDLIKES